MLPTNAGYIISFFVCAMSSSSHFSVFGEALQHLRQRPVSSPARIRLANTVLNTSG